MFFGPEAEFFIFDSVKFGTGPNYGIYQLDSMEGPQASLKDYPEGNMGHRPTVKGGYFPVPPVDSESDLRAEMLSTMGEMGVVIEKHHHEVAQSQHELGMKFGPMVRVADHLQIYKYCIHNVAHSYGKTATFMPKPIYGDNGSGMHVHQSIWKGGRPVFAGNGYADLSETALYYIGGIIKHAKALNIFTNPATNSYKRLIPGFEAPVLLAYSARNRSASCRIPYATNPKAKRVEVRFPDPCANPYLAFSAMLMAGLDGIKNKIHPGDPMDKDLYDLPPDELKGIPTVCGSLREALGRHRGRPRIPPRGRRVQHGPDRELHRTQVERGVQVRAHASPGRVRDVLLRLTPVRRRRRRSPALARQGASPGNWRGALSLRDFEEQRNQPGEIFGGCADEEALRDILARWSEQGRLPRTTPQSSMTIASRMMWSPRWGRWRWSRPSRCSTRPRRDHPHRPWRPRAGDTMAEAVTRAEDTLRRSVGILKSRSTRVPTGG